MNRPDLWILAFVLAIPACANRSEPPPPTPPAEISKGIDFGQVAIRVKQEVGFYQSSQPTTNELWKQVFIQSGLYGKDGMPPPNGVCGSGKILLNIQKVEMDFLANYDTTHGVSGGLTIPFGPPALSASIGPSGGFSSESIGSVEVKHTYYVPAGIADSSEWDFLRKNPDTAVFKGALEGLRNGLIAATGHKPCFVDAARQTKPDPETAVFSIQIKRSGNVGVGFNILLAKLSDTNTSVTGGTNKITVTYVPSATGAEFK